MKKWFFVFIVLFLQSSWSFADVTLVADDQRKNNVVASALEGSWRLDTRLDGFPSPWPRDLKSMVWKFKEDLSVLKLINEHEYGKSATHKAYSVGHAIARVQVENEGEMEEVEYSAFYAVIERSGNPALAFFYPNEKNGKGDWEFSTVMLARARKAKDDLLFMGGDRNENVAAYRRLEE